MIHAATILNVCTMYERPMTRSAITEDTMPDHIFDAPIVCPEQKVQPACIDYNDHMNMAYYSLAFDLSLDYVYEQLGLGPDYKQGSRCTTFSLEAHVMYLREVTDRHSKRAFVPRAVVR